MQPVLQQHDTKVTSEGRSLNANICPCSHLDQIPSEMWRLCLSSQHYQTKWAASVLNISPLIPVWTCRCSPLCKHWQHWYALANSCLFTHPADTEALIWSQIMNTSLTFPLISGLFWSPVTPEGWIYASRKYLISWWCRSDAFMAAWQNHPCCCEQISATNL